MTEYTVCKTILYRDISHERQQEGRKRKLCMCYAYYFLTKNSDVLLKITVIIENII